MPDTSLTDFDRRLAEMPRLTIGAASAGNIIPFQFPPRVTADVKSSKWDVQDVRSYEPLKWYAGSEARAMTMEFEYIATDSFFTPMVIGNITKGIKEYFYKIGRAHV